MKHDRRTDRTLLKAAFKDCQEKPFWEQLTPQKLAQLRGALERHWSRLRKVTLLVCTSAAAAAFHYLVGTYGWPTDAWGATPLALDWLTLIGTVVVALYAGMFLTASIGGTSAVCVDYSLMPLQDAPEEDCEEALRLMRYPSVLAFRDQVLANGRELLRGDFAVMQEMAHAEAAREGQERRQQVCRELHGIAQPEQPA